MSQLIEVPLAGGGTILIEADTAKFPEVMRQSAKQDIRGTIGTAGKTGRVITSVPRGVWR